MSDTLTCYLRWSVVDTANEGGYLYHVVLVEQFNPDGMPWPDSMRSILVRFDTLSARLLMRDVAGVERGWPKEFPCSLEADFDSTITCDSDSVAVVSGFNDTIIVVGDQQIVGTEKFYYMPSYPSESLTSHYWFGADLGLTYHEVGLSFQFGDFYLPEFVRVGDVEYGEPVPVAAQPSPPAYAVHLEQNAPNPAHNTTAIPFRLPAPGAVRLTVYDLLGREVALLVDGVSAAGRHSVRFDVGELPVGVYVLRLEAAGEVLARTVTVVR